VLSCQSYFRCAATPVEAKIRADADFSNRRIEVGLGAAPGRPAPRWAGSPRGLPLLETGTSYDESMILFILAPRVPTHPVAPAAWEEFVATYRWGIPRADLRELLAAFATSTRTSDRLRGIRTARCGEGIDYFENSRRATYATAPTPRQTRAAGPATAADVWG